MHESASHGISRWYDCHHVHILSYRHIGRDRATWTSIFIRNAERQVMNQPDRNTLYHYYQIKICPRVFRKAIFRLHPDSLYVVMFAYQPEEKVLNLLLSIFVQ